MVYYINYNYKIGTIVFIVDENDILECQVTQITLEVDPNSPSGSIEIKTYHLYVMDERFTIVLRPEDYTFPTSDMAVDHMCDPSIIAPPVTNPQTIEYTYVPSDVVWTYDGQVPIEAKVIQITFDIDPDNHGGYIERTIYHVLPTDGDSHSTLLRNDYEVFGSIEEATAYIQYLMELLLSPTPTISVTPSVTQTCTPTQTSALPTPTATPSPTPLVTPSITPTITPTPSPVWPYILLD